MDPGGGPSQRSSQGSEDAFSEHNRANGSRSLPLPTSGTPPHPPTLLSHHPLIVNFKDGASLGQARQSAHQHSSQHADHPLELCRLLSNQLSRLSGHNLP